MLDLLKITHLVLDLFIFMFVLNYSLRFKNFSHIFVITYKPSYLGTDE